MPRRGQSSRVLERQDEHGKRHLCGVCRGPVVCRAPVVSAVLPWGLPCSSVVCRTLVVCRAP
eukprot:3872003-Pyramimonas_sp.AAC.1